MIVVWIAAAVFALWWATRLLRVVAGLRNQVKYVQQHICPKCRVGMTTKYVDVAGATVMNCPRCGRRESTGARLVG